LSKAAEQIAALAVPAAEKRYLFSDDQDRSYSAFWILGFDREDSKMHDVV
jgi:hypothetical protein